MNTRLEAIGLTKIIHGKVIVDAVSLTLEAGTITGFRGVNGSGKTMLMRLLCGLITPTRGNVLVNGTALSSKNSFPDSIGILIENPAFLDYCSGRENLQLLSSIRGLITNDDIDRTLHRVGLGDAGRKKYRKYSLGMKQRLGIAAAILESPDIVLLDEPFNALDVHGIAQVSEIIRQERERGALVILSCHDASLLDTLADVVYTIAEGVVLPPEGEA